MYIVRYHPALYIRGIYIYIYIVRRFPSIVRYRPTLYISISLSLYIYIYIHRDPIELGSCV